MKSVALASILALLSSQAHALSCMRPDPVDTFQRLAAAEESYFVLFGELTFDEAALPQGGDFGFDSVDGPDPIDGRFVGKGLTSRGFTNTYVSDVILQVGCAGPWCGSARSGGDALYFVPLSEPPATFQAGPCGGMIFADPSDAVLDMLTSCMQGGNCTPVQ